MVMNNVIVINIGSTSTKVGLFADHKALLRKTVDHTAADLAKLHGYEECYIFHRDSVDRVLLAEGGLPQGLDLVVSRGGLTKPLMGGAYAINETMMSDLRSGHYGWHPSNVGPEIASRLAAKAGTKAIIYDSPVTDELTPLARFSGLKGVNRDAAFHVLGQKSAARKAARDLKVSYNQTNFVVAHLGGGITIGAHMNGHIVDGTHGLDEGPFTPQRTGALPLKKVIDLCFSGTYSKKELLSDLFSRGGVYSYLGTQDIRAVEALMEEGDREARLVIEAMSYQISKEICAMASVLKGQVHAVVLTGNLCKAATIVKEIQRRVSFLGPVLVYPGEDELESLASGGYGVLASEEIVREYGPEREKGHGEIADH
jgi:butyrate kinase